MGNAFVHVELHSKNVAQSKKFYSELFEWKLEEFPGMDYTGIEVEKGTGGGMMTNPSPNQPDQWMPYIEVDNVHEATNKAENLGGKVRKEVTEVSEMGWFSIIEDPTGATFGLWQSKK